MKRLYLYFTIIFAFVALSCDILSREENDGSLIYISAGTEGSFGVSSSTKVPYLHEGPLSTNESSYLDALVLVSTRNGEYIANGGDGTNVDGAIGMHVPAVFRGASAQVLNGPIYNKGKKKDVYFSAFSPNPNTSGWIISEDGKTASFAFNGTQDLMFASQETGSYDKANPSDSERQPEYPHLNFNHLLTLINLSIYAESEDVKNAWGNITSIKIQNAYDMEDYISNYVTVNLGENHSVAFIKSEHNLEMPFYIIGTNTEFPQNQDPGYELKWKAANDNNFQPEKVAYVMMAPVVALAKDKVDESMVVPEFEIVITTTKRTEPVTISADLIKSIKEDSSIDYFYGSTAGLEFNFTLKFTMGNTIAVQAVVTDWKTGGYGVGDVTDTDIPDNNTN